MNYRKKKWSRRSRRKYVSRTKMVKAKLYRKMNEQGLFHVKQHVNGSTISGINSRTITQALFALNFGIEFRLRDIPQFGTFANIWDSYRINKIVFKMIPMANMNATGTTNTFNNGIIASVLDYDNAGQTLTALDQYEQYSNCKISPVVRGKTHTRVLRPRVNIGAQNQGGALLSGINKGSNWIDCSLPDIVHNGIKLYVDPYPAGVPGGAQTWQIFCKYYVSFRNVH